MIPRVGRDGESLSTTRATRAHVTRTGRRSAGIGERNIHHADCTNVKVNIHTGTVPRCKNQAHLSKHLYRHTVG